MSLATAAVAPIVPRPGVAGRITSFIKWPGGKGQLLYLLLARMPREFGRYFEPMLGSGALFFALWPEDATLSDGNAELVNGHQIVRDQVGPLLDALETHENTLEHYLSVRAQDPATLDPVACAARLIYLNKTGFNGLYRVNGSGRFNVPYGRRGQVTLRDDATLIAASLRLGGARLRRATYEEALEDAKAGDLVYLDPPYLDAPRLAPSFRAYQAASFGDEEHRRLAQIVRDLDRRGCHVLLSNSDAALARDLYRGFRIETVPVRRKVGASASSRENWSEILVYNFDPGPRRPLMPLCGGTITRERGEASARDACTTLLGLAEAFELDLLERSVEGEVTPVELERWSSTLRVLIDDALVRFEREARASAARRRGRLAPTLEGALDAAALAISGVHAERDGVVSLLRRFRFFAQLRGAEL